MESEWAMNAYNLGIVRWRTEGHQHWPHARLCGLVNGRYCLTNWTSTTAGLTWAYQFKLPLHEGESYDFSSIVDTQGLPFPYGRELTPVSVWPPE